MLARPGLSSFEYVRASISGEVIRLLQRHGESARLPMGGTDLFPCCPLYHHVERPVAHLRGHQRHDFVI